MVQVDHNARVVNCKIVYCGPPYSGKTTNIEWVHGHASSEAIGELITIARDDNRTLYFDHLPVELGPVGGMKTKLHLYTVPGHAYDEATRKLVLQGADGIIFVADSHRERLDLNVASLRNVEAILADHGVPLDEIPIVVQYNKRDLRNALSVKELNAALNPLGWPAHEATAVSGQGVFPTLKSLAKMVLQQIYS